MAQTGRDEECSHDLPPGQHVGFTHLDLEVIPWLLSDSFENALAETVNGYYKAELIRGPARHGPWRTVDDVELATPGWVHWHNTGLLNDQPPAEFEGAFYAALTGSKELLETK